MRAGKDPGQDKVLNLDRGLFIVHYDKAEDAIAPPRVLLSATPGSERNVEWILHPDAEEVILWQPDAKLVIRTSAASSIRVQVLALRPGGSRAATVRIEPVSQGEKVAIAAPGRSSSTRDDLGDFRLLGHVAGRGDVLVGANEWIAGPSSPSRIEGVMLSWADQPEDLEIRYAVKTMGAHHQSARMVDMGTFVGTRGRALPISSLVIEMSGDGAAARQFVAEAVFLNSPMLRATGRRVLLSGPTGREPMVGLRITIEGADSEVTPRRESTVAPRPVTSSGRVRVFRSRPRSEGSE
jgi:hypothetical protein